MPELKPCPFCGGEAKLSECPNCGDLNIMVDHADDCWMREYEDVCDIPSNEKELYLAAWNTRVKPGDDKSLTDEEREILNDMPALKRLAMIAGFEVER